MTSTTRSIASDATAGAKRGRPRSAKVDAAIIEACRDLLMEGGYEMLSIEAVAARAGVGKATIYRRWPGKPELVIEVLEATAGGMSMPDTGDTEEDLTQFVTAMADGLAHSPLGGVIRGLAAEFAHNRELAATFNSRFIEPRRAVARGLVIRGIERGDLDPDADPDLVLDILVGALHHRLVFTGRPITDRFAQQIVEMVWSGIAVVR